MRYLVKTLTLLGTFAAASAAHAATEVITDTFDYTWKQSATAPFTTSFTLVESNPDYQAFFDTSLGTLDAVTVQWSNLSLTMQGYGAPQASKVLGVTVSTPAALGGAVIAETEVNGNKTGVLGVVGGLLGAHSGWLGFTKAGNAVSATFDATNNPNGVFSDAAAGQTLDIQWNTGTVATLFQSTLPTSGSGLVVYGIQPEATLSPFASLSGDVIVTFDYSPTGVPEPSTWAMMLAGFAGVGVAGWRAAKKTAAVAA